MRQRLLAFAVLKVLVVATAALGRRTLEFSRVYVIGGGGCALRGTQRSHRRGRGGSPPTICRDDARKEPAGADARRASRGSRLAARGSSTSWGCDQGDTVESAS